jgi:hypothetical protein
MKRLYLALMFLTACSASTLPKYSVVQGLRVLGLVSDVPEINFDGATFTPNTVNLTPVVSDIYGAGRTLKYNIEFCLDPGISLGATPNCVSNPTRTVVASDQNVVATATFLAPNYMGSLTPIAVDFSTASAAALTVMAAKFASVTATQLFNGLNLLVVFEIFPDGDTSAKITSFKRIVFSAATKVTKNANPTGLEIRENGAEITTFPAVDSAMEAFLPTAQAENFSLMNSDGTLTAKTEVLETTWFLSGPAEVECSKKKECTTDGLFQMTRTRVGELNPFYVPQVATPTSRGRVLIGVARDDRGGAMIKRYCVGTCP